MSKGGNPLPSQGVSVCVRESMTEVANYLPAEQQLFREQKKKGEERFWKTHCFWYSCHMTLII